MTNLPADPNGEVTRVPADAVGDTGLTAKELILLDSVADLQDRRSKDEKCRDAGMHCKRIYWLQKHRKGWNEAVIARMREGLLQNLPSVYSAILGKIHKKGDLKAAELYLRAAGEIQQGTGSNQLNIIKTDIAVLRPELQDKTDAELLSIAESELAGLNRLKER